MPQQKINPELLRDNCYSSHTETVPVRPSESSLAEMRKTLEKKLIQVRNRDNFIKEAKLTMKGFQPSLDELFDSFDGIDFGEEDFKTLKSQISESLQVLDKGFYEEKQTVYLFDYQDENVMAAYNQEGELIYQRPLLPTEKTLFSDNVKNLVNS